MAQEELAATCHQELKKALPDLPDVAMVARDRRKAGDDCLRTGNQETELESAEQNLFLAGDYLDPDYPPTLEAAVRSGIRAANASISPRRSS